MSDRPDRASVLDAILAQARERVAVEQGRRPLGFSHPAVTQAPPCARSATLWLAPAGST